MTLFLHHVPNYSPNNNRTVSSLLAVAIKQSTHLIQHRLISTSQLVHFQPAVSNINIYIYIYIVRENPIKKRRKKLPFVDGRNPTHLTKRKSDLGDGLWFRVFHIMYLYLSLSIYLSIDRSIYRSIYLSICLPI